MKLDGSHLARIAGRKRTPLMDELAAHIAAQGPGAGLTTVDRMAAFLANGAVETGGFARLEENLNYTSAKRIREVWPSRFRSEAEAAPFVRKPRELANKVYGGRMGNKGKPDAGWRYRGSGFFQTTGHDNFAEVERATGLDAVANPETLRQPGPAVRAAIVFVNKRDLSRLADKGMYEDYRRRVNGGDHGMKEMLVYLARARTVLAGLDLTGEVEPSWPPPPQQPIALTMPADALYAAHDDDKPVFAQTTNIAALGGFGTTVAAVLGALAHPAVQIVALLLAAGFAFWILKERRRRTLRAREIIRQVYD